MIKGLPEWGTREALMWGIAHPDWPWHTPETRAEYEYPDGRWWKERYARAERRRDSEGVMPCDAGDAGNPV